jgi:hypothetical protein
MEQPIIGRLSNKTGEPIYFRLKINTLFPKNANADKQKIEDQDN